ncbi:MAG TPA: anthranilate phosphoribosyltransferase [Kofleriaceae bacterium]|nr:anthranilate phosphoribosyltransferase [Kofleriaceae bacterium]
MSAIVGAIGRALDRQDLSRDEMARVIDQIMDGHATPAQIGGLLVALRAKGEAVDELVGAATAMRGRALPLACPDAARSIDTCGTGGDGAGTINVSTLAAILLAACGAVVAKHGNRAQSSRCGSADVLETLGVAVDVPPPQVEQSLHVASIGFLFAPRFHSATRHVAGPRRELGTRTIFNLLGPLTNPARVRHQVVGVYDARWCEPMAAALGALGVRRAAVVHGAGGPDGASGLDELAVRGESHVALYDDEVTRTIALSPASFGVAELDPAGLAGGDAAHNAAILRKVLAGHLIDHGERLEAVLVAGAMAAALGLELLEPGRLDLARLPAHYRRAEGAVRSGAARLVLHKWALASHAAPGDDLAHLTALAARDFAGVE